MQLRNYMPKTLFGRMLGIILIPMILVQIVTVFIFYERHWDSVTRQMANSLSGEIQLLVTQAGAQFTQEELPELQKMALRYFGFKLSFSPSEILSADALKSEPESYAELSLTNTLRGRLDFPFSLDLDNSEDEIAIHIQLANGVLHILAGRKRIISSTGWTFLGWTIGTSIILFSIALVFMRAQVRPIRQLAHAARQLGLGRETDAWQLSGAREVRLAGRAFQAMRHRINRQISERTAMLAGVSHDLRTPLTRMRLQMALMPKTAETDALEEDIIELEQMIDGYLAFARGEGEESAKTGSIPDLLRQIISQYERTASGRIAFDPPDSAIPSLAMRPQAMRRALDNLIGNAMRYAKRAEIRVKTRNDNIFIFIDDDGPGIEPEFRADALRPFVRLEGSRNRSTGGTGLGLAIASDIILGHGGEITLDESPLGGLRIIVQLPV
ncbi:MAG: ATP-binding protein [Candidatus Puniceispirillaceae bacterium]